MYDYGTYAMCVQRTGLNCTYKAHSYSFANQAARLLAMASAVYGAQELMRSVVSTGGYVLRMYVLDTARYRAASIGLMQSSLLTIV
jgi:hypothetical protein